MLMTRWSRVRSPVCATPILHLIRSNYIMFPTAKRKRQINNLSNKKKGKWELLAVAQLVERSTVDRTAAGSIPAREIY